MNTSELSSEAAKAIHGPDYRPGMETLRDEVTVFLPALSDDEVERLLAEEVPVDEDA